MKIKHIVDPVPFEEDDIPDDLEFDYEHSQPNRFADKLGDQTTVVLLDSDVSAVFTTSEAANRALRHLIEAMPDREAKAA